MNLLAWSPFVAAIVPFVIFYFMSKADARKRDEQIIARLSVIETKVELVWAGLLKDAANILHHPDPDYAARDGLLEKLLSDEINQEELIQLQTMLEEAIGTTHSDVNPGEAIAASILLRMIQSNLIRHEDEEAS